MDISPEDMTLIKETDKYKFKFMIKNISGERSEGENFQINEIYFDLLMKVKESLLLVIYYHLKNL